MSPRPRPRRDGWESAVHTVLAELPAGTHTDDVLDAVYGIVGHDEFTANEAAIAAAVERLR